MYSVTNQDVVDMIESDSPLYGMRLENVSTEDVYGSNYIFSILTDVSSTTLSDDIELGAVCAQSVSVKITGIKNIKFLGESFRLYIYAKDRSKSEGITYGALNAYKYNQLAKERVEDIPALGEVIGGELIPMGKFTCVKHKKHGDISELELYDRLYFSDDVYTPSVELPAPSRDIENDICNQLGIENGNDYRETSYLLDNSGKYLFEKNSLKLKTSTFVFTITSIPEGCTKRQMLSYIAAACGQFGFIDRFGRYVRKWYGKTSLKTLSSGVVDEPTLSERANTIVGVSCTIPSLTGGNSSTLTVGNTDKTRGRVLEFENPYMQATLLKSLFVKVKDFNWYTTELKHRLGDPRFDLGDVVSYDNCNIPITNLKFDYSGGLSAEISAAGRNEEELV